MLETVGLHFSYGRVRKAPVLSSLSWKVSPGLITLLVGVNGAGKSTLLNLLSGSLGPSAGKICFDGDSRRSTLHREISWMPQAVLAARNLTTAQQVELAAWAAGCSSAEARGRALAALERVQLVPQAGVKATQLSGGQLRRLGLAQAISRQSPCLLLDEPTAGLDPAQAKNFRKLLREVECPAGMVVSSHQINELQEVVDRVAVLHQGSLAFDGTTAEFRELGQRMGIASGDLEATFTAMTGNGLH